MEEDELTTTKTQAVFEFTKRKRWADVLVSELVNVAVLVFSPAGAIIHADAAAHAVTGYSEDQLLGKNFSDILHGQFIHSVDPDLRTRTTLTSHPSSRRRFKEGDALAFFQAFEDSIAAHRELTFYLRIRAPDRRDQTVRLVELKANPFTAQSPRGMECLCVYAMLAPYPSSAVSDLDDFLALKTENAQLAQRIEVRYRPNPPHYYSPASSPPLNFQLPFLMSSCQALRNGHGDWTDGTLGSDGADSMSEDDFFAEQPTENIVDKSERALAQVSAVLESAAAAHNPGAAGYSGAGVDQGGSISVDGPLKKKRRLTELAQGRTCTMCGRNNSPEWRKGPSGPKSLCNACGLRYAKKSKTKDGDGD